MYYNVITQVIAEHIGCSAAEILPTSTLKELGFDSLSSVELLMDLEASLGFPLELDRPLATVGELAMCLHPESI